MPSITPHVPLSGYQFLLTVGILTTVCTVLLSSILLCLVLSCLDPSYFILSSPTRLFPFLSHPVLSYSLVSCSALIKLVPSSTVLICVISSCFRSCSLLFSALLMMMFHGLTGLVTNAASLLLTLVAFPLVPTTTMVSLPICAPSTSCNDCPPSCCTVSYFIKSRPIQIASNTDLS
jgi:hypothetical protein